jgi:putative nucleotidyltransferase with HDIG domain
MFMNTQRDLFLATVTTLAQAIELRDAYTGEHCARVTNYSLLLAQQLGLPPAEIELLRAGAPLHDLGMIGIEDKILRKPGRLTPEEYKVMQSHTTMGDQMISTIPDMQAIRPIVRSHHERWDGAGYPDRLAGDQIPLLARIVAVADAFDAMTSNAPYHPKQTGRPPEVAFAELRKQSGHQFDPACATAFLDIQEQIIESMAGFSRTR